MQHERPLYTYLEALLKPPLKPLDNEKPNEKTLGFLLRYFVQVVESSPGLESEVNIDIVQRRFQQEARRFFRQCAKAYLLGKVNGVVLEELYNIESSTKEFRRNSVEWLVVCLASEGHYVEIGQALVDGAQEHYQRAARKAEDKLLGEHEAIRRALMSSYDRL